MIWKVLDIASKMLVPIAIAYFAYAQNSTVTLIQTQQQERGLDLTLVSLVWPSLIGGDVDERTSALALVETFNPELKRRLVEAVIRDPGQSAEIAERAQRVLVMEETSSEPLPVGLNVLAKYKIDIYFDESSERDRQLAQAVKAALDTRKLSRLAVISPRPISFLSRVGQPRGYEIRYERGVEDDAAATLATILESSNAQLVFGLREVGAPSPGLLSIFIFSKTGQQWHQPDTTISMPVAPGA